MESSQPFEMLIRAEQERSNDDFLSVQQRVENWLTADTGELVEVQQICWPSGLCRQPDYPLGLYFNAVLQDGVYRPARVLCFENGRWLFELAHQVTCTRTYSRTLLEQKGRRGFALPDVQHKGQLHLGANDYHPAVYELGVDWMIPPRHLPVEYWSTPAGQPPSSMDATRAVRQLLREGDHLCHHFPQLKQDGEYLLVTRTGPQWQSQLDLMTTRVHWEIHVAGCFLVDRRGLHTSEEIARTTMQFYRQRKQPNEPFHPLWEAFIHGGPCPMPLPQPHAAPPPN